MTDPDPSTITLTQIGADGLVATLDTGTTVSVIGQAVMDADRDRFRWLVESAASYHGMNLVDSTGTGMRGKSYRANRAAINYALSNTLAMMDDQDIDVSDARVGQLTQLVLDRLALPADDDG